jgi:hypothetical protein
MTDIGPLGWRAETAAVDHGSGGAQGEVVTSIDGIDGVVADRRSVATPVATFDVYLESSQEVRSILVSVDVGKARLTEKVIVKPV